HPFPTRRSSDLEAFDVRNIFGKYRASGKRSTAKYSLGYAITVVFTDTALKKITIHLAEIGSLFCQVNRYHAVADTPGALRKGTEGKRFQQHRHALLVCCYSW